MLIATNRRVKIGLNVVCGGRIVCGVYCIFDGGATYEHWFSEGVGGSDGQVQHEREGHL